MLLVSIFENELTLLLPIVGGIQLEDAFWEEVNAVCEEFDAQSDAKSQEGVKEEPVQQQQQQEEEEEEEEESLVLSCGDASLPPVISITAEGGEV